MTLGVVERNEQDQPLEPELKTGTWRVLRRDPDTIKEVTRWVEKEPLTGSGKFGYYPDAAEVGKLYGEGDYILIREEDGYARAEMFTVVADTVYRRAEDDEQ